MVADVMMLVVVVVVVWNCRFQFFVGFVRYGIVFWYRIVFVPGFYVGFYVWWSARGDNGGQHVRMGLVMLTGFGQFWSDLVETWTVRS